MDLIKRFHSKTLERFIQRFPTDNFSLFFFFFKFPRVVSACKMQAHLKIDSALRNFTGCTTIDFNTKGNEAFIFESSNITVILSENFSLITANDRDKSHYIDLLLTSKTISSCVS